MARHYAWGDYFWPNTTVLANKLGIVDAEELREVEHELTADRQEQIERGEVVIARTFDNAHLCAVHAHLFGEVYDWAGQWRTVDMVKGASTFAAVPWGIEARLAEAARVAAGTDWAHVDREGFAQAMGAFYAEINHAHSFREGNGRTGKLVLDQLAERSSFALDWDRISGEEWNQASARTHPPAFSGRAPDRTPLVPVFRGLIVDRDPGVPGDADVDRARDAVRLAGLSHPRSVHEQLADRRYGGDSGGYRAPESTPHRGREEERGR